MPRETQELYSTYIQTAVGKKGEGGENITGKVGDLVKTKKCSDDEEY